MNCDAPSAVVINATLATAQSVTRLKHVKHAKLPLVAFHLPNVQVARLIAASATGVISQRPVLNATHYIYCLWCVDTVLVCVTVATIKEESSVESATQTLVVKKLVTKAIVKEPGKTKVERPCKVVRYILIYIQGYCGEEGSGIVSPENCNYYWCLVRFWRSQGSFRAGNRKYFSDKSSRFNRTCWCQPSLAWLPIVG